MQEHEIDEIALSSITFAELQYGIARSARRARHITLLIKLCAPPAILPFDDRVGHTYGCVRAELERAGTPIGPLDTLIAVHAQALKVTLVTNNEGEFSRVVGLSVENWMR